jgi:SAM-dependent methyltransferase
MKKINKQKEIGHWGDIIEDKIKLIKKFAGKRILDVGCSKGDYVFYLIEHGYDAYGCDTAKDIRWRKKPKNFKVGNIYNLPYEKKSFDTVIAFEIFEHLDNLPLALKEISRVSTKNIIISVPNCELPQVFYNSGLTFYHHIDKTHINHFTGNDIRELLQTYGYTINAFSYISPIRSEVLFLYSWYIPLPIASFIGKILSKISINKKIYSDLLVVASIKNNH